MRIIFFVSLVFSLLTAEPYFWEFWQNLGNGQKSIITILIAAESANIFWDTKIDPWLDRKGILT